jgi:hypothetical protein
MVRPKGISASGISLTCCLAMGDGELEPGQEDPDDVEHHRGAAAGALALLHPFAERRGHRPGQLERLDPEGDADEGQAHHHAAEGVAEDGEEAAEDEPQDVAEGRHGSLSCSEMVVLTPRCRIRHARRAPAALRYNARRRMIDLYSPLGEMELLILRSILDDAGIPYFIRNDTFGSLYQSPYAEAYNRKTICVARIDRDEASVLVREFLRRTGPAAGATVAGAAAADEEHPAAPPQRLLAGLLRLLDRCSRRLRPRPADPAADLRRRLRVIRNDAPDAPESAGDAVGRPPLRLL